MTPLHIVAKGKCKPDNAQEQVLCKVDEPTNSQNQLATRGFVVSHTSSVPKHPLRLIVSRTSEFGDLYNDGTMKLLSYIDTLECGHQGVYYPFDAETGAKRHRCAECAKTLENRTQKKPCGSVPAPIVRKKAA